MMARPFAKNGRHNLAWKKKPCSITSKEQPPLKESSSPAPGSSNPPQNSKPSAAEKAESTRRSLIGIFPNRNARPANVCYLGLAPRHIWLLQIQPGCLKQNGFIEHIKRTCYTMVIQVSALFECPIRLKLYQKAPRVSSRGSEFSNSRCHFG